jgi:hypothetical protein
MMTTEQFEAILTEMSNGQSARAACVAAGVTNGTLYRALDADPELAERYAQARTRGHDRMADEMLDIADAREGDVIVDEDGRRIIDNEAVQRAKLRVDTRKWLLSKMAPKKYGERTTLAGDPDAPFMFQISEAEAKL